MIQLYNGGYYEDIDIPALITLSLRVPRFEIYFKYISDRDDTLIATPANEISIKYNQFLSPAWEIKVNDNGTITTYTDLQDFFEEGEFTGTMMIYYDDVYLNISNIDPLFSPYLMSDNFIFTFLMNDEKNKLDKDIQYIDKIHGVFKRGLNIKSILLDIEATSLINFNYVYVASLKRFYYVDNFDLTTKNIITLHLSEDVLMTYKELIYKQKSVLINRSESDYYPSKEDSLYTFSIEPEIEYITVTPTIDIFKYTTNDTTLSNRLILTVIRGTGS